MPQLSATPPHQPQATAPGMTVSPLPPHHCSHTYTFFFFHIEHHQVSLLAGLSISWSLSSPIPSTHSYQASPLKNTFQGTSMAQKSTRCIAVFSLELHINFISHSYLTTTNRIPHLARLSSLLVPTSLFLWHFLSLLPVLLLSSKYLPLCLNPF